MKEIIISLNELFNSFTKRRKIQLFLIIVVIIISALFEIFQLALFIPLLNFLLIPERSNAPINDILFNYLNVSDGETRVIVYVIIFGAITLFSGIVRLFSLWLSTRISLMIGNELGGKLYYRLLHQPYEFHLNRPSNQIISLLTDRLNHIVMWVVIPVLNLISSVILVFSIAVTLFIVNAKIAFATTMIISIIYFLISRYSKYYLNINSMVIARQQPQIIKALQEGIGGIRDVILDGIHGIFLRNYQDADYRLRKAYGSNIFIGGSPRFFIETVVMILFAFLALIIISSGESYRHLVPILALFAVSSQKLMPSVQNAYFAYTSIAGSKQVLGEVIEYLELPLPKDDKSHRQKLAFRKRINFKQIHFGYKKESRLIFENLDLQINKGEKIGIIGKTGSGKSTLIDILIGLLKPAKGNVYIDGVKLRENNIPDWQLNISHVPQVIFLSDSSIAENIAFGRTLDEIDYANLENVIAKAGLSDFVKSKKDGYKSLIGERGVRLSGGQRQRIGIARALYKGADLIIFDEATNALDSETENEIVSAIYSLDKSITVIMIAHRLSTLKLCDKVYEIKNGGATRKAIRNLR